ncbi:hypothetical protein DVW87_00815 [Sphingomonas aracearum]|uniref:CpsD/CapB family tyrosine-protein kinase n=1 Tax=Sphingomonas aracearum TaxID=2283317 RepID=A0A369VXF6_9SPHN|nr:hypothetical protein DVW87_00815 [Sphingomonas aracearum]
MDEPSRISVLVEAAFDHDAPLARLARSLRTSAAVADGDMPIRSVALLGVDAPVKAAALAANLAVVYAQAGSPTLLVDAAAGKVTQADLFATAPSEGLTGALIASAPAMQFVRPTAVRHLSVLPAGRSLADTAASLDAAPFHRRIVPLLETFDIMIVSGSLHHHEVPAFCAAIDAAVLVVQRHVTQLQIIRQATERLRQLDTHLLGVIVAD